MASGTAHASHDKMLPCDAAEAAAKQLVPHLESIHSDSLRGIIEVLIRFRSLRFCTLHLKQQRCTAVNNVQLEEMISFCVLRFH